MGRRLLYSTEQEQKDAKRERERIWRLTDRGKQMRSQQNHRAYENKQGPVKLTLRLPYIPFYIEPLSQLKLNLSSELLLHHFNDGLRLPDERQVDDEEFASWDRLPPYHIPPQLQSIGLAETKDALHGYRMRLQHLSEFSLVSRYEREDDLDEMWREVHRALAHATHAFPKMKKMVQAFKNESTLDYEMGMHWLQWKACAIIALKTYWIAMKNRDPEAVRLLYESKWVSAQ